MKISVIVPVYNVEKYLKRCMDSLIGQTFSDREILLVDDGSTDGSGALCDQYAVMTGIRAIHQENAGLGMARNRGLSEAKGDYVLFIDSDDYVNPEMLENLYQEAEKQRADVCISGFTMVAANGKKIPRPCVEEPLLLSGRAVQTLALDTAGSLPEEALDSKYGMTACARLYRRKLLEDHHIRFVSERELISEDLIFNLEVLRYAKRAVITAETDYFYCINSTNSLSKRHRQDRFSQDCRLYEVVKEMLARDFQEKEYDLYLRRLLISRARFDMAQEVAYYDQVNKDYPLKQAVEAIIYHEMLQAALQGYPWWKLPKMQGIFALAMKKKKTGLLMGLLRLRRQLG